VRDVVTERMERLLQSVLADRARRTAGGPHLDGRMPLLNAYA
jgi:hypothetical protein